VYVRCKIRGRVSKTITTNFHNVWLSMIFYSVSSTQSFPVCASRITAMCGVNCSMWLGTSCGEVFIVDVFSKHKLYNRYLAVHSVQSIVGLYHIVSLRSAAGGGRAWVL